MGVVRRRRSSRRSGPDAFVHVRSRRSRSISPSTPVRPRGCAVAFQAFADDWQAGLAATAKRAIVSLVEQGGEVRSFYPRLTTWPGSRARTCTRDRRLHTDESRVYWKVGYEFIRHEAVNHGQKEYARSDVTTNTIEGSFSIFKCGMVGVYHYFDDHRRNLMIAK